MENKTVLALDLSTSSTGWALFDASTHRLLAYGALKPKVPGKSKMGYLERTLLGMESLAVAVLHLVEQFQPTGIVIEEIAGSKNRLSQKTLDGFHWIVLSHLRLWLSRISYYDVSGADGWRRHLGLRLSEADKLHNKEAKKVNKKLTPSQRIPEVTPKHLAARHVNAKFGMILDVDRNSSDNDIADAIAIGDAFLTFKFART